MKRIKTASARLLAASALLLGCNLGLGLLPGVGRAQNAHAAGQNLAPYIGAPAIPFDLRTLDGRSISLRSFSGKPLMMNFFASWCDPCREEMPLVNELAAKAEKTATACWPLPLKTAAPQ